MKFFGTEIMATKFGHQTIVVLIFASFTGCFNNSATYQFESEAEVSAEILEFFPGPFPSGRDVRINYTTSRDSRLWHLRATVELDYAQQYLSERILRATSFKGEASEFGELDERVDFFPNPGSHLALSKRMAYQEQASGDSMIEYVENWNYETESGTLNGQISAVRW